MDMVLRISDCLKNLWKLILAILQNGHFVVPGYRAHSLVEDKQRQFSIIFQRLLSTEINSIGIEKNPIPYFFFVVGIKDFFTVDFPFPVIDADRKINDHSDEGQKYYRQQIGQGLCSTLGIVDYSDTDKNY